MICKKYERAAIGLLDNMRDPMFQRFPVASLPWIGHFLHDEYPHLFLEIERTAEQRRLNFICADATTKISEVRATDRERGAGHDARTIVAKNHLTQDWGDIDRRRVECEILCRLTRSLDPIHMLATTLF